MKIIFYVTMILVFTLPRFLHGQSPDEIWVARYNGTGSGDDVATAIAVDHSGNVYVTGGSFGTGGTSYDYVTIKYNNEGAQLWIARYNGPGNGEDIASDVAIDENGNVYVTGWSTGLNSSTDYATIKYDAAGNQQWVARYSGPGDSWDEAFRLIVKKGYVYVTGASVGTSGYPQIATIKYDTSGNELWVSRYGASPTSWQEARSLAVDDNGNVYLSGWVGEGTDNTGETYDFVTLKCSPDGNLEWVATYDGPAGSFDRSNDLKIDNLSNVYVTGLSYGGESSLEYATVKYNSDGEQQWVARYNGPGNGDDIAVALELFETDDTVEIVVTGFSRGSNNSRDFATVKYNLSGEQQWVARYGGPSGYDEARALAIDEMGNIYVTGLSWSDNIWTSSDYATIKYNATGEEQRVMRYVGPGSLWDEPTAIVYDAGKLYVTGLSYGDDTTREDYATIKYATAVSVVEERTDIPITYWLSQNYPNPFNPSTVISFALPEQSQVTLKIFNILGQHVKTLISGEVHNAGYYDVIWDGRDESGREVASGVYLYRIQAGNFVRVKKMLFLK